MLNSTLTLALIVTLLGMTASFRTAFLLRLLFSLPLLCSGVPTENGLSVGRHDKSLPTRFGSQGVNMWKLHKAQRTHPLVISGDGEQRVLGDEKGFPKAQYFEQPLDHFDKNVNKTFGQR